MLEGGRQGLADQLTLSQPGGTDYPHPVLLAPPDFQTLRHACYLYPVANTVRLSVDAGEMITPA